jgi:hypothetical protein
MISRKPIKETPGGAFFSGGERPPFEIRNRTDKYDWSYFFLLP